MKVLAILALSAFAACAQLPIISNITVTTDTNASMVSYSVSDGTLYCSVRYGVASGSYLWSSQTSPATLNTCYLPITGLKDGLTYFYLPSARPDPDDDNDICNVSSCGALEVSATEPTSTVSHLPAPPAAVSPILLSEPDTSAYAIVNLEPAGAGGECVATSVVLPPAGYTIGMLWGGYIAVQAINAGDTLTTILNPMNGKIWYGTVFQASGGTTCIVPYSNPGAGIGYQLPNLPVDPVADAGQISAANHRFIFFRTTPVANGMPPFGFRTGSSFWNNYAIFQGTDALPSVGPSRSGFIFQASGTGGYPVHHVWIENLKMQPNLSIAGANWGSFIVLGNGEGGDTQPFPQYIAIRGNYFHAPPQNLGAPATNQASAAAAIAGTMQGNIAIVGNYTDNLFYQWNNGPVNNGLAQWLYFMDCGSGNPNCPTNTPVLIDNNYYTGCGQGLYVESNNHVNNGPQDADFTVTHNAFYWPYASLSYSAYLNSLGCCYGNRVQLEEKVMARQTISGNYFNGQWASADSGEFFLPIEQDTDINFVSNYATNVASVFGPSGQGNGGSNVNNISGNRIRITNNVVTNIGRGLFNAGGAGAGTFITAIGTALDNLMIDHNTIGPISDGGFYYPWVIADLAGNQGAIAGLSIYDNIFPFGAVDPPAGAGILTQQTIAASGTSSHPATPTAINSPSAAIQSYTSFASTAFGYVDGTPGLGIGGLTLVSGGAGYPASGPVNFAGCASSPAGTFSSSGGVINSFQLTSYGSGCNPALMTATADTSHGGSGALLRPSYGLTPSYTWYGNVMACTDYNGSDMSDAQCAYLSSTMPAGDVYATGGTTALRFEAAGLTEYTNNGFGLTATADNDGVAGANIPALEAALGIVSNIRLWPGVDSAVIFYTAPDSNACSVDASSDGTTWTRTTDEGGGQKRVAVMTNLTPGTNYQYRLMCYFDQSEAMADGWFSFPSDATNLATDGTFTTALQVTRRIDITFRLPAGAAQAVVTLTPATGSPVSQSCTSSPCVFNVNAGSYTRSISYQTAQGAPVGAPDSAFLQVN